MYTYILFMFNYMFMIKRFVGMSVLFNGQLSVSVHYIKGRVLPSNKAELMQYHNRAGAVKRTLLP